MHYNTHQKDTFERIGLTQAWELSSEFTISDLPLIAVLDTGVDITHPDLDGKVSPGYPDGWSRDFSTGVQDGEAAPYGLEDTDGHGTHVAATILNKAAGILGASWSGTLVSLKVFGGFLNNYFSYIVNAIDFAEGSPIDILNFSGNGYSNFKEGDRIMVEIEEAIENFTGIFIWSSGNDGQSLTSVNYSTAANDFENLIAVGATKANSDEKADFSNYGNLVHIFAPGTNIISAFPAAICDINCFPGNFYYNSHIARGYHYNSGTSMAAPFCTALAATVKAAYPSMIPPTTPTASQIKDAILAGVDEIQALRGSDDPDDWLSLTGGRINFAKTFAHLGVLKTISFHRNYGNTEIRTQAVSNGTTISILEPNKFTREGYVFAGWAETDDGIVVYTDEEEIEMDNISTLDLYAVWRDSYEIGDTGPAGGIVFYDKGNHLGGWQYLEAAPFEIEFDAPWGYSGDWYFLNMIEWYGTAFYVETGQHNTQTIISYLDNVCGGGYYYYYAVRICDNLTFNGFNDWFLPSLGELKLMHKRLYMNNLGNFQDAFYWSSSGNDLYSAVGIDFYDGSQLELDQQDYYLVRPIRAF